jgi:aspartate/methionine/tyrosine aminotransferase
VFCERLLRQAGVAGSVFYPQVSGTSRRLRFTFSKSRRTIEEAARRLAAFQGAGIQLSDASRHDSR